MDKIEYIDSFFTYLLVDQKSMYKKWSDAKYHMHVTKFVAMKSFEFTEQQLPPEPPADGLGAEFIQYHEKFAAQIAVKIVDEYHQTFIPHKLNSYIGSGCFCNRPE